MSGFRFTIPVGAFNGTDPTSPIEVVPDKGMTTNSVPRVLTAKFGDGYEQRVADGLNPIDETLTLAFAKRTRADIDNIVAFFASTKGTDNFDLILSDHTSGTGAPNEKTIKVVCTTYTQTYLFDNFYSCTANLKRVYTSG